MNQSFSLGMKKIKVEKKRIRSESWNLLCFPWPDESCFKKCHFCLLTSAEVLIKMYSSFSYSMEDLISINAILAIISSFIQLFNIFYKRAAEKWENIF